MTITTRPLTQAEADAQHGPSFRRAVEVQVNDDARATIGRASTIHLATVWTYVNAHGDSTGNVAFVACGSRRYRNTGGRGDSVTTASNRYAVDCQKCLADI